MDNIFVAIDVETTGLSPVYNELIEISAIKYKESGNTKVAGGIVHCLFL